MSERELLKAAMAQSPQCLSSAELDRLVSMPDATDGHLSNCARCQAELTMLRAFQSDESLPDEGAAVAWIGSRLEKRLNEIKSGRAPRERGKKPLFEALLSYARLRVLVRSPKQPDLSAHLGNAPEVFRSQEIEVVGPSGKVAKAPEKLEWETVPGADNYKAEVMEVDQTPLWSWATKDNFVTISPALRARMVKGKAMLWRVTALDKQNRIIRSSQVQRFIVSDE
jgi:hypothetical protein